MAAFWLILQKFIENFEEIKIIVNLESIDSLIVCEGLQHGCKQKSVALLVKDLEIWWRHSLKINKCHHFESSQGIKKLPRQIYCELPEVPFKNFNSKKNVIEFYTHLFKRFELYADIWTTVQS